MALIPAGRGEPHDGFLRSPSISPRASTPPPAPAKESKDTPAKEPTKEQAKDAAAKPPLGKEPLTLDSAIPEEWTVSKAKDKDAARVSPLGRAAGVDGDAAAQTDTDEGRRARERQAQGQAERGAQRASERADRAAASADARRLARSCGVGADTTELRRSADERRAEGRRRVRAHEPLGRPFGASRAGRDVRHAEAGEGRQEARLSRA